MACPSAVHSSKLLVRRDANPPRGRAGSIDASEPEQNLWRLYCVLRRLAANRGTRTQGRRWHAMSIPQRRRLRDLSRTSAAPLQGVRLRMARGQESVARLDAAGQVGTDHAGRGFRLARLVGRRCRCCWPASEKKGPAMADRVQRDEQAIADLPDGWRVVCVWAAGVPGRHFTAGSARRDALGRLSFMTCNLN